MRPELLIALAAAAGLLMGRLIGIVRRRLLLDVLYGAAFVGWGADAERIHYQLRARPWAISSIRSALAQLERMGLVDGWPGDPLHPNALESRRYACRAVPPPSAGGPRGA